MKRFIRLSSMRVNHFRARDWRRVTRRWTRSRGVDVVEVDDRSPRPRKSQSFPGWSTHDTMSLRTLIQNSFGTHPLLTVAVCNLLWLVPPSIYFVSDVFYFNNPSMSGYVEHTRFDHLIGITQALTALLAIYSTANLLQFAWPSHDWSRILFAALPLILIAGLLAFAIVSHIMS